MSHWPFLLKHLSYSPVNPFDSFYTWRESTDPTLSNSLDYFSIRLSSVGALVAWEAEYEHWISSLLRSTGLCLLKTLSGLFELVLGAPRGHTLYFI